MMKSRVLNLLTAAFLAALLVTRLIFDEYTKQTWVICNVLYLLPCFFLYDPGDTSEDYGCLFILSSWTVFFIPFLGVSCLHAALGDQVKTYADAKDDPGTALRVFCWLIVLACAFALFILARGVFSAGSAPAADRSVPSVQTASTAQPASNHAKKNASPLQTAAPKAYSAPKPTATPKPKTATYKTTPRAGIDLSRTVYVSTSGGKIHLRSNCSGMKYYDTMTYGEACERGYVHCKKCFK